MSYDPQAVDLNEAIRSVNPHIYNMFSDRGKAIFFPKKGILSQSAEAKGVKINGTIGTALEDDGTPMVLKSLSNLLNLQNNEAFAYAPSFGRPEIRSIWKETILKKNPLLQGKNYSLPVVTSALTHGLSMAGYLFVNEGDEIISPDLYWENYDLVFTNAYGATLKLFPTFVNNTSFNTGGLKEILNNSKTGKKIVVLNFPNNPTGYTVTENEAIEIKNILVDSANKGNEIVVMIDDAYFGLVFEEGILKESIFSYLADAHENILAVKFDGPTKEDYVWGFRTGFVTFACAKSSAALYSALESKIAGAIRGNISNASNVGQTLLLSAYANATYENEKVAKFDILKRRYDKICQILKAHPEYEEFFTALPFNSGYFMCVRVASKNAENVRKTLIEKYSTGVISQGEVIRIAFSSVPIDLLERMFDNIFQASRNNHKE
jgi:aspartate/methionine/tyrosine aminotransferase